MDAAHLNGVSASQVSERLCNEVAKNQLWPESEGKKTTGLIYSLHVNPF